MSVIRRVALATLLAIGTAGLAATQAGEEIPAAARERVSPLAPSPEALRVGKALWRQHCFTCHGPEGRGDGPNARLHAARKAPPRDLSDPLVQDNLTDGEIFWRIGHGIVDGVEAIMPDFSDEIPSERQRWRLVRSCEPSATRPGAPTKRPPARAAEPGAHAAASCGVLRPSHPARAEWLPKAALRQASRPG